jgi:type IV secretory pathway VirJ component
MNSLFLRVLRGLVFFLLPLLPMKATATKPVHYGLFGNVHVAAPAGTPKRTIVFISDSRGWDARAEAFAAALADDGALVLGVDLPAYLKEMLSIDDKCSLPGAHIEEMSHWMQREQNLSEYVTPVLAGDGAGATFAYAIDAQAPKGTFTALATVGWDFSLRLPKPLCAGDAGKATAPVNDGSFRIVPVHALPNAWLPLVAQTATSPAGSALAAAVKSIEMQIVGVPAVPAPGGGLPAAIAWLTAPAAAAPPLPGDVADLPLIEVPAQGTPAERVAIILTGDGGWAGLDIAVADQLAKRGIAVVGLSSVKYFWQTRKPEQAVDGPSRKKGQ